MSNSRFYEDEKRYFTHKEGLLVRSKGEREVANFLYDQKLEFEYERMISLGGQWFLPDFYLCDWDILLSISESPKVEYIAKNVSERKISTQDTISRSLSWSHAYGVNLELILGLGL